MAVTPRLVLTLLAALALGGCHGFSVHPASERRVALNTDYDPWSDAAPAYRLGEGDKVQILFPLTPEMDEESLVRPDGVVFSKASGDVAVSALTVPDAAAAIAKASEKRLKNPSVQIKVLNPAAGQFFVGGEVKNPGVYPLNGPANVLSALMQAGGSLDTASLDEVILIRRSPNDRPMRKTVNIQAMLEGRAAAPIRLYQGDMLFIPKSGIAEWDVFIDQFVNKALPFTRSFAYTIGQSSSTSTVIP